MSKITKKIIQVLMILCVAFVLGAGLFWFAYLTQHPYTPKKIVISEEPVSPEDIVDPIVENSGRNYIDNIDEEGNLIFNEDGTITRTIFAEDKYYLDGEEYKEIDTNIVDAEGDFEYQNTTNITKTYFNKQTAEDDLIKFEVAGNRGVSFSFSDTSESEPKIEGNTIVYPSIQQGLDAKYTVSRSSLLEELITNEIPDFDRISQDINLQGVYFKEQDDGSITFHDEISKNIVFEIPPPLMYELTISDENDEIIQTRNTNYDLHYEIEINDSGGYRITKVIDKKGKEWLQNAKYPVAIDNTYFAPGTSLTEQGYVMNGTLSAASNAGALNPDPSNLLLFFSGTYASWPTTYYRTLLNFDTSYSLPAGASVVGAVLNVHIFGSACYRNGYGKVMYAVDEGEDVNFYSAPGNQWTASDFSNPSGLYTKTNPTTAGVTYEGVIDTTEYIQYTPCTWNSSGHSWLPSTNPKNGHTCLSTCGCNPWCASWDYPDCSGNQCLHQVNLPNLTSTIATQDTKIIINPELIGRAGYKGIYVYGVGSAYEPSLTVYYVPSPQIDAQYGYCSTERYKGCDQDSHCTSNTCLDMHSPTSLVLEIQDNQNDERNWQVQILSNTDLNLGRVDDNYKSWTSVCSVPTGSSTNVSCSSGLGTYSCNTTQAGSTGSCAVKINGLQPETKYYFRVAAVHDITGQMGNWSDAQQAYTASAQAAKTYLLMDSQSWNTFRVGCGLNWLQDDSTITNDVTWTYYNIGLLGNWGSTYDVRFLGPISGSYNNYTAQARPPTSDYPELLVNFGYKWMAGHTGDWIDHFYNIPSPACPSIYDETAITVSAYMGEQIRPNFRYYAAEFSRDAGRPEHFVHYPIEYWPSFGDDWVSTFTRARNPSPPVIGNVNYNSIQATMDASPPDYAPWNEPSTPTNAVAPELAMSVQNLATGEIQWFGRDSQSQFFGSMPQTPNWATDTYWQYNTPRVVRNLNPGTTYRFRAVSKNSNSDGKPRWIGDNISWGFPDNDLPDDYEVWPAGYPYVDVTTPLAPPTAPTVDCYYDVNDVYALDKLMQPFASVNNDYLEEQEFEKDPIFNIPIAEAISIKCLGWGNGICDPGEDNPFHICYYPDDCSGSPSDINDYYCEVDINDPINTTPNRYYNIQRRACPYPYPSNPDMNCGEWQDIDQNGNDVPSPVWFSDPGIIRDLELSCSLNNEYYDYQVRVSTDNVNGSDASDFSAVGGDYMPPSQPGKPEPTSINITSIDWRWTAPQYGATASLYKINHTGTGSTNSTTSNLYINQSNSVPNSPHYLAVSGQDGRLREGAMSEQSNEIYTLADNPTFDVRCGHDSSDYCRILNINDGSNNRLYPPQYCLSRQTDGGVWYYFNTINEKWSLNSSSCWDEPDQYSNILDAFYDRDIDCRATYNYRIQAKNDAGSITPSPHEVPGIPPPCPPAKLGHTNNDKSGTNYYVDWRWTNTAAYDVDIYEGTSGCDKLNGTRLVNDVHGNVIGSDRTSRIHYDNQPNREKSVSICYDTGGDNYGTPATASAYTAIQNPTKIQAIPYSTSPTDQIVIYRTSKLSNVDVGRDSIRYIFDAASSDGGNGGDNSGWIDDGDDNSGSWPDGGLDANRKYCYRLQARNNQPSVDGYSTATGDVTALNATASPIDCTYTYANIPSLPIRRRVDENTVNVIIRDGDGNPRGPAPVDNTSYSICVTQYGEDGADDLEAYVQSDGTLGTALEGNCNSGVFSQPSVLGPDVDIFWQARSGWGGDSGVNIIGLDPSKKYGFKVKAANGDDKATNFGPTATLFLVRNNVVGWAWSSNVGWVSLNCLNLFTEPSLGYSCDDTEDWGVNTNFEPTREINPLEGYAWASSGLHIQDWLTGNVSRIGSTSFNMHRNNSRTQIEIDSQGNPHVVWSEYQSSTDSYDVYYLKKINNIWQTADGTAYQPGVINPDTTGLNVSNNSIHSSNTTSLWPSLVLDNNDIPHIAWTEGGWSENEWKGHALYYSYWDETAGVDGEWTARSLVDNLGSTPSIALTDSDQPMIAFMHGNYQQGTDIYLRKLVGGSWVDVDEGDGNSTDDENVSNTVGGYPETGSIYPDLEIDSDNYPNIVWTEYLVDGADADSDEDRHVYFRKWDGTDWVSASGNTLSTYCYNDAPDATTCTIGTGNDIADCGGHCHYDAGEGVRGNPCTINDDCGGFTCVPNYCQYEDTSVNWDLYTLGIDADFDTTYAGKGVPDLELYPDADDTPGVLFSDSVNYTIFRKWDNGSQSWVDVDLSDSDPDDDLWVKGTESDKRADDHSNYGLEIDDAGNTYVTWTGRPDNGKYNKIYVRRSSTLGGQWETVSGDDGDNKLVPYDIADTHSEDSAIAVDDEGNVHVVWAEIELDTISDCTSNTDCTNALYPECIDDRCVRTCASDADCPNYNYGHCIDRYIDTTEDEDNVCGSSDLYYSKWEAEPNKSGTGWITFNKYVCENDTQKGCSVLTGEGSDECGGGFNCIESAGVPPSLDDRTYGYCYTDRAIDSGEKYGICSKTDNAYCTESDLTDCLDPEEYCIFNTCSQGSVGAQECEKNPPGEPGATGQEECRATSTANFSGETREIEGWARILSSKQQGERYVPALTDWGWIELGGNYDNGQGESGEFTVSGIEIDAQQFLGDPDVSADSLALYTLFGWGWNADLTNYNSLSRWLPPHNITKLNRVNYLMEARAIWSDVDIVLDDVGDTHMAWSEYNPDNNMFDIYYAKLSGGKWRTASGQEYDPEATVFSPNSLNLDVSYDSGLVADGYSSRFPSLALDSNNQPHIAFQKGADIWEWGGGIYDASGIIYTYWNGSGWENYSIVESSAAETPTLALDDSDTPYITYKTGQWAPLMDIYLKVWNGDAWNTITNDGNNLSVSSTEWLASIAPHMVLEGSTPHITWRDGNLQFYRWWNGNYWATAREDETATQDGDYVGYLEGDLVCVNDFTQTCTDDTDCDRFCHPWADANANGFCSSDADCDDGGGIETYDRCIQNECQGVAVAVNWGMRRCSDNNDPCYENSDCVAGTCVGVSDDYPQNFEAHSSDIDLFSDGTPGIAYNDSGSAKLFFRRWDPIGNEWTDINKGALDHVRLSDYSEFSKSSIDLYIDEDDQPQVVYDEKDTDDTPSSNFDIRYLRWDNVAQDWLTINGNPNNDHDSDYYKVHNSPDYISTASSFGFDQWGNPHVAWIDTQLDPDGLRCGPFSTNGILDGINGTIHDMAIDEENNEIYLVGVSEYDAGRGDHWRIDKRRMDDSSYVTGFGWYENPASNLYADIDDWDNGIIVGDTNTTVGWSIELDKDNNTFYLAGVDNNNWRIEKRYMDSGDRVAGFGSLDDTDWPDNPAGVVRTDNGDAGLGMDMKIDDDYIYLAGMDDSGEIRIEKRYKDTGELVYDFGSQGVVTSTDGADARKIVIEGNYMWVGGHDDSGNIRVEKRFLSSGDLESAFGSNGVFTGSSVDPDTNSIYGMVIDGDYLYTTGRTEGYDWLVTKLNKINGELVTEFDGDGYLTTANRFSHGIAIDQDKLIITGREIDGIYNYWHYERRDKDSGELITDTYLDGWINGEIDSSRISTNEIWVWGTQLNQNYMFTYGDFGGNWRLEKRWLDAGTLDDTTYGLRNSRDCTDPEYPICVSEGGDRCAKSNIMLSRWTPGNVQGGIGWVEFMPAGALLGVPWVQTAFADIFGTGGVNLAPPPRGSGEYTATYLILSDGSVQGIPTNYSGNFSQDPTSQLYEFGLNPLIERGSLPFGEDALSQIKFDSLITDQGDNKNRYGHDLVELGNSEITDGASLGTNKVLDNSVYYYNGNATISNELIIEKGDSRLDPPTAGDGLLVINGDLEINSNIYYYKECSTSGNQCYSSDDCNAGESCGNDLSDVSEMQSMAILVRGNIYINSFVTQLDTALIAIDDPATEDVTEGVISTSRKQPTEATIVDGAAENDLFVNYDGSVYNPQDEIYLKFGQDSSVYDYRKQIFFKDVADLGPVSSFPLQVYIDSANDVWTRISNRDQVNFTDANGVSLDFHFEKFDDANDEAVAWVEVPVLTTDGNDYIWMYYGGTGTSNAEDEEGTYNDSYKAVYHLSEDGLDTRANSTQYSHDATPISQNNGFINNVTGKIDGADQFDGELIDSEVASGHRREGICSNASELCSTAGRCSGNPSQSCWYGETTCDDNGWGVCNTYDCVGGFCDGSWESSGDYLDAGTGILSGRNNFTVEAWFKTGHAGCIIEQRTDKIPNNFDDSQFYEIFVQAGGNVRARAGEWLNEDRDGDGNVDGARPMWDLNSDDYTGIVCDDNGDDNCADGEWHHVVLVQDTDIDGARLYVDGREVDSQDNTAHPILGAVYLSQDWYTIIGSKQYENYDYPKTGSYFNGELDEVKISDVKRSADWIRASYLSGRNTSSENIIKLYDGTPNDGWGDPEDVGTASMNRTFLRWNIGPGGDGISIPPGAEIRKAYIELTGADTSDDFSFGNIKSRIYLIDEENISSLDSFGAENLYKIDVTNSVSYDSAIAEWENDDINRTPDIKSLISRFISSETYENNYNSANPTALGLVIQEDPEDIGGIRRFVSAEGAGDAPRLVVEYSPRRVRYGIEQQINDTTSWLQSGTPTQDYSAAANYFGYSNTFAGSDDNIRRAFLRFQGIDLPVNAEIIGAYIGSKIEQSGTVRFALRQALLTGYGDFSSAPFNMTRDSATNEVEETISDNQWMTGENANFADISRLVKAFIERTDYIPGEPGSSEMSIRLRIKGDDETTTFTNGQYRSVENLQSYLNVDFRMPIEVNGLMVATGFNFDRKYSQDLAPAERIVYDGRVLANTPPGLSDFTKTLPIYQRVAP